MWRRLLKNNPEMLPQAVIEVCYGITKRFGAEHGAALEKKLRELWPVAQPSVQGVGEGAPPVVTVNMFGSNQMLAELREIAAAIHYPECWDTFTYPRLSDAVKEIGCNPADCTLLTTAGKGGE